MQGVRDRYPALFNPAINTMQLFIWQHDILGVAHYIMDCFEVFGVLDNAPDDASTALPAHKLVFISPGGWIDVIYSFIQASSIASAACSSQLCQNSLYTERDCVPCALVHTACTVLPAMEQHAC